MDSPYSPPQSDRTMTEFDLDKLASDLEDWLQIDSTSGREHQFLEVLEQSFRNDRWSTERQQVEDNRFNLIARTDAAPKVLFSTHVDTVPPFLPIRRTDDAIYGRGACDTKGGLLAMWEAARRLRADGIDEIGFLLVVGEEVDHCGAKVARSLDLAPEQIILCEPTQNRVVEAQRGMLRFELRSRGIAGHSAFPDDGASAIDPLLEAIGRLRDHRWPVDDLLGPTTFNIGIVEGGVAANVFAPRARAELLFRAVSPVEELLETVEDLVGDDVDVEDAIYNDPVFFRAPTDVDTCTVPFNTDATYLAELGEVWLVGPGDIRNAHSDDEHIEFSELAAGIDLYMDLARRVVDDT